MRTDLSPPLPLSVQDWPILPNANLTVLTKRLYLIRPREAWCGDRRHGWFCTRERDHLLPHVACGRLTIADFQLASMATYWRESAMPLREFPSVVRWLEGLQRLPAWADPWPARR